MVGRGWNTNKKYESGLVQGGFEPLLLCVGIRLGFLGEDSGALDMHEGGIQQICPGCRTSNVLTNI